MRRGRKPVTHPNATDVESALDALAVEDLRELVRDLLLGLDGESQAGAVDQLLERAARKSVEWTPRGPTEGEVSEIVSFVEQAGRGGYAEADTIDEFLRQGTNAFLAKNYVAAGQIFQAILPPLGNGELYLGQEEIVEDVLGVDLGPCAMRCIVSAYMTTPETSRADAVLSTLREVGDLGLFRDPLREMERLAVEPLPGLDEFLPRWKALVEESVAGEPRGRWDTDEEQWLREVTFRLDGVAGLARIARSTRRHDDLRAWSRTLVESRDWKGALSAFEESAEIVLDGKTWRGDFLDGAALAAQELGRRDLPKRLEAAWRDSPTPLRLRRWLGSARSKVRVRKLATQALEICPSSAGCQRAVLHLILGDFESAAKHLAAARGLGWSRPDHPGHRLFHLFPRLLKDPAAEASPAERALEARDVDRDDIEQWDDAPDEPRLRAVEIVEILETAGVRGPILGDARAAMLSAMRTAAGKRVKGVTAEKRRRYYDHAAQLVAMCAVLDQSSASDRWVSGLRAKYSRYPALQREFGAYLSES